MYQASFKKIGMAVALSLSLTHLALAAPDTTNHAEAQTYSTFPVNIEIATGTSVTLMANEGNQQFTVSLPNKTKQTLRGLDLETESPAEANQTPVTVADYNFDGYQDIATYGGMAGMVNAQYNLYLWNPSKQNFSLFKGDTTNLEWDAKHQFTQTSSRSGPRWYGTYYASDKGKLYKALETAMVTAGTQEVGLLTFKNKAGTVTKTVVTDLDMAIDNSPSVSANVQGDKVYLYNQPNEASQTAMYLINHDEVTLKGLADIQNDRAKWCLGEYKGKKTVTKWLKCENL